MANISDNTTEAKHIKPKQVSDENTNSPTPSVLGPVSGGKKKTATTNCVVERYDMAQGSANVTAPSAHTNIPNPLPSRAGPISVKQKVDIQVQVIKAPTRNGNVFITPRTPRVRKKPAVNKFIELKKELHTKLEKGNGVVVECTYLAQDGRATMNDGSQSWTHLLQLSSSLPFHLIKFTVLTGPYAQHLALLIRQETSFRFLDLPIHIRTKVYTFALKHHEPAINIFRKSGARKVWAPEYQGRNLLGLLRTSKQVHVEAAPMVYAQTFSFPGTQVACEFLLRIQQNRPLPRSLCSESYSATSARTMFHLLSEARHIERLSFAHVSSSETPKKAVNNIWNDAGSWLATIDRNNPEKGLDILAFDDQAFHMREKDKEAGGFRVTCWGPTEQLEFLKGLRTKIIAEGRTTQERD